MTTEDVEEKTTFKFTELSDSAKERAIQDYALPDDWYEYTIDNYKHDPDLKAKGYDIDEIYFSGFSSQGDGASWKGRVYLRPYLTYHMTAPEDVVKREALLALIEEGWIDSTVRVTQSGHYCHSNTMLISDVESYLGGVAHDTLVQDGMFKGAEVEPLLSAIGGEKVLDDLSADILSACRELADKIYKDLEADHDGYFEEDAFAEHAAANDWEFDENGVLE